MKTNKFLVLICSFFLMTGCGTDTGNPSVQSPFVPDPSQLTSQLVAVMCYKITNCFSTTLTSCGLKIRSVPNISTALGVNESTYANLTAIQSALNTSALSVDSSKSAACFDQIYQASCNSTEVQTAYSSSDPENLNQSYRLLSLSSQCSQFIY